MNDFFFAAEAMLPTACIMFCGYGMKKRKIVTDTFLEQGDRLCFSFFFPVLVFWNLYQGREHTFSQEQYGKVIFVVYAIILVSAFGGMALIPKFVKDRKQIPVLIQAFYRGNFMLYGLPFSEILGGRECLVLATTITAVTMPLLNMIAIFQFSYYTGEDNEDWLKIIGKISKNPIIWGVLTGLFFQKMDLFLPSILETTVADLAVVATPLAFLLLGCQLHFQLPDGNGKMLGAVLFYKMWLLPLIILPVCHYGLHMNSTELIPIFIFVAAPAAITTYQLAHQYNADSELAREIIVSSLFLSVITMFLLIILQRYLNWI